MDKFFGVNFGENSFWRFQTFFMSSWNGIHRSKLLEKIENVPKILKSTLKISIFSSTLCRSVKIAIIAALPIITRTSSTFFDVNVVMKNPFKVCFFTKRAYFAILTKINQYGKAFDGFFLAIASSTEIFLNKLFKNFREKPKTNLIFQKLRFSEIRQIGENLQKRRAKILSLNSIDLVAEEIFAEHVFTLDLCESIGFLPSSSAKKMIFCFRFQCQKF